MPKMDKNTPLFKEDECLEEKVIYIFIFVSFCEY